MNKLDEKLFEFAEVPLKNSLEEFINQNGVKTFNDAGHNIEYYDCGSSDTLILMIPSSNGNAITFFKYVEELSQNYRVVVPNYDTNVNLEEQSLGFLALTDSIPHKKLIVFGYSFGGIVAQVMVKLKPSKINGICLLDSEIKTANVDRKLVKRFVKSYTRLDKLLKLFSVNWMHSSLSKQLANDVKIGLNQDRHFWEALYKQVLLETSKERMRLIYNNVREYWISYEFVEKDFESYKGNILIMNLEDSISRVEVKELTNFHKRAKSVIYNKGFRMSLVSCYNNVVSDLTQFAEL